jgi:hypothetical protein
MLGSRPGGISPAWLSKMKQWTQNGAVFVEGSGNNDETRALFWMRRILLYEF